MYIHIHIHIESMGGRQGGRGEEKKRLRGGKERNREKQRKRARETKRERGSEREGAREREREKERKTHVHAPHLGGGMLITPTNVYPSSFYPTSLPLQSTCHSSLPHPAPYAFPVSPFSAPSNRLRRAIHQIIFIYVYICIYYVI